MAKWIHVTTEFNGKIYETTLCRCSECGYETLRPSVYCPKCGTKMGVGKVNNVKCRRRKKIRQFLPGVNKSDTFYMGELKHREDLDLSNGGGE